MTNKETPGDRLRFLRDKHGDSQTDLARKMFYKRPTISKYETSGHIPKKAQLMICRIYNVPEDYFECAAGTKEDVVVVEDAYTRTVRDGNNVVSIKMNEPSELPKLRLGTETEYMIVLGVALIIVMVALPSATCFIKEMLLFVCGALILRFYQRKLALSVSPSSNLDITVDSQKEDKSK